MRKKKHNLNSLLSQNNSKVNINFYYQKFVYTSLKDVLKELKNYKCFNGNEKICLLISLKTTLL